MAKKRIANIKKTPVTKRNEVVSPSRRFGYAAYMVSGLSSTMDVLLGFNFRKNEDPDNKNLTISKVYFNPNDNSFREELVDGLAQTRYAFAGIGADEEIEMAETDQLHFDNFQFKTGIRLVFFGKDELIPLLQLSDQLLISGCQIQYGLADYDPPSGDPSDRIDPERFYFTLKIEARIHSPNQRSRGPESNDLIPTAVVGQPCPPKWVPSSMLAALTAQIPLEQIVHNMRDILENWTQVVESPGPQEVDGTIHG